MTIRGIEEIKRWDCPQYVVSLLRSTEGRVHAIVSGKDGVLQTMHSYQIHGLKPMAWNRCSLENTYVRVSSGTLTICERLLGGMTLTKSQKKARIETLERELYEVQRDLRHEEEKLRVQKLRVEKLVEELRRLESDVWRAQRDLYEQGPMDMERALAWGDQREACNVRIRMEKANFFLSTAHGRWIIPKRKEYAYLYNEVIPALAKQVDALREKERDIKEKLDSVAEKSARPDD